MASSLIKIGFGCIFIFNCLCATAQSEHAKTINLTKGQILSLIAPIGKDDGEASRSQYYQKVLPVAYSMGLKREIQLQVTNVVRGDYMPKAMVLFTWPNQDAEQQMYQHPQWPDMKSLRPLGWEELRIYTSSVKQDTSVTFSPDKFYTLAVAWVDPQKPNDYAKYMNSIQSALEKSGGKLIFTMDDPRFEAHATQLPAPQYLNIVEWGSLDGLERLQQSADFKQNSHLLKSGVNRFEFYRLSM